MKILLTGATGYVGRHLLAALLQRGFEVAVLGRPGKSTLADRIDRVLAPFPIPVPRRLLLIEGELTRRDCSLPDGALTQLEAFAADAMLHCAGLTRFDESLADEVYRCNLVGTRCAFHLARSLGIAHFHHVSTAYVAGDAQLPFSARDLDRGQCFRNPYEASKYEAERFLHAQTNDDRVRGIHIYRPSIVVGGQALGENGHASTVYTFIKALRLLRGLCLRDLERGSGRFAGLGVVRHGNRVTLPLRVALKANVALNLVPVSQVVHGLIHGLENQTPGLSTQSQLGGDIALTRLKTQFCEALDIDGIELVDDAAFDQRPATAIETFFQRATREYRPYLEAGCNLADHEKRPGGLDMLTLARDFCAALDEQDRPTRTAAAHLSLSRSALDTLAVRSARDYFDRLVGGNLGESLQQRIAFVRSRIRFLINSQTTFDRTLHFDHGQLRYADEQSGWDFSFEMAETLFLQIIRGESDMRQAFFLGRLKIRGDVEAALKFGFLMSDYLRSGDEHLLDAAAGH